MNIFFVSSEFPTTENAPTGGIGTYLVNLTTGLINQGHKVIIITREIGKNYEHKNLQIVTCSTSFNIIKILIRTLPFKFFNRIFTFLEYPILFSLEVFFKLKELEKKVKIDIIEGNDFGGELFLYLLLTKKRSPVVLRLHTPSFVIRKFNNERLNLFYWFMELLEVYCLKKADSLYSPTKNLADIISKTIKRKIDTIIPYPFKPLYETSNIKKENNFILFVGKLQPKKGVFTLINAIPEVLKRNSKLKFSFVGPDTVWQGKSVKEQLIKICLKFGIQNNVEFLDEVSKKDLYKLYKKSTITVIPSKWENFPNVCLEAMSQQSVVVATNIGGLREIIYSKHTGILIPKNNIVLRLSEQITRLLKDDKLREELYRNAESEINKKYNINNISKLTVSYYNKVKI